MLQNRLQSDIHLVQMTRNMIYYLNKEIEKSIENRQLYYIYLNYRKNYLKTLRKI